MGVSSPVSTYQCDFSRKVGEQMYRRMDRQIDGWLYGRML